MTTSVITAVQAFLRDAQARVGVLTGLMIALEEQGSQQYEDYANQRKALYDFMEILNDNYTTFIDSPVYTFLQAVQLDSKYPPWTDREILQEIDHLRSYGQLITLPFYVFVGYYPQVQGPVFNTGGGGSGWTPPPGDFLQIFRYDAGGNLVVVDFPDYAGARDLTIDDYYTGRT